MLDELVDTSSNFDAKKITNGVHSFRVLSVRKAGLLYVFDLSYEDGKEGEIALFANLLEPLLKVLGCEKDLNG